jgi:hypothetical protein
MTDDDHDNPGDEPPPPRLLNPWFWLALIFCLACIIAGLAVAKLGPKYL